MKEFTLEIEMKDFEDEVKFIEIKQNAYNKTDAKDFAMKRLFYDHYENNMNTLRNVKEIKIKEIK